MKPIFRPHSLVWLVVGVAAVLFVVWNAQRRVAQIERISSLAPAAPADDRSPTGYARGTRSLLLPAGAATGQPWIMDVQHMAAAGTWRAEQAGYDNAPEGRAVHGAAPYRWWLRWLAGGPGRAVERAALQANPVLLAGLCAGLGLLLAWRFGAAAGGATALAVACTFPLSNAFAAGLPDDHALLLGAQLAGALLLLAGIGGSTRAARICFLAAGLAGGLGLWVDAGSQLVALAALGAGGAAAVWFAPRAAGEAAAPLPWRWWAAGGAVIATLGWAAEATAGGFAGRDLATNHPLLALAWLGGAELLTRLQQWRRGAGQPRQLVMLGAIAATVLLAPVGWLLFRGGIPADFGPAGSLLAAHTSASSLPGWIRMEGADLPVIASLLPLLLGPAAVILIRRHRALLPQMALLTGALAVLLGLGAWQLRWWGPAAALLPGLLGVTLAAVPAGLAGIGWRTGLALLFLPGLLATWPRFPAGEELSPAEARLLVERDLAQWLATRSEPGTIAFAPPALSASLCYYGGLRVVASPYTGNHDGLALSVRIAAVTSTDEAQALVQRRGIRYLILPSWDTVLDEFSQLGSPTPERSLIALLRQWLPPRWLRPVAYQQPLIPGLERDSVAVFEVVEPQENAIALSRLAEYFVEIGQPEMAAAVGDSLERNFATDTNALIARAQVALARNEGRTLARIVPQLLPAVADGKDEDLPWERRANLAVVLAQLKRPELARAQVEFCLEEADLERLRSLGPVTLYRLLTLARSFQIDFAEPGLRDRALELLPAEFQSSLQP